jgi:hypothetical protein
MRHKIVKPGDPPCQCARCLERLRRLGGELPLEEPAPAEEASR